MYLNDESDDKMLELTAHDEETQEIKQFLDPNDILEITKEDNNFTLDSVFN